MTNERKCQHGYGIKQGPCPVCDSADDIRYKHTCIFDDHGPDSDCIACRLSA